MANIFRSKEVYKHLKYDLHNRNEMVAVQGVYITGEYRPPYYNEPCVHIYEISGQDCIVANFESEEVDTSPSETSGMYKFGLSQSTYNINRYGNEHIDISSTETSGMYKFGLSQSTYNINRYGNEHIDTSPSETSGMYKFGMDFVGYMKTYYSTQSEESTPEPTLRLSSLTSENCVITNYNRTRSDE